ncbi:MAG: DUF1275 domain-containing protein [Chitinophagaceae bacterium]|nr:MAG: DUF1275 domain-containing protein [Chitinophagaceae bacterium]
MFRHVGKARTENHNRRIASLLSFVAGIVNVAGFLSIHRLTTNVTGHFAFLMEEVLAARWVGAAVFAFYLLSFLLGAFVASLLIERVSVRGEQYVYAVPASVEILILTCAGLGWRWLHAAPDVLACSLLFAMGLQNAMATSISQARVRTTHLTGLFTDLGIELSQLLFYKSAAQKARLHASIRLRTTIIGFFFAGGIAGGLAYTRMESYVLVVAAALLLAGLVYDQLKVRVRLLARRFKGTRSYKP